MPNSSDECERACFLLLLLELLKRQQPDLKPEAQESFLSLVGGRRRRRSAAAVQLFEEGLREFRRDKISLAEPLEAVVEATSEILRQKPDLTIDRDKVLRLLAERGLNLQRSARPAPSTISGIRAFLKKNPGPEAPTAEDVDPTLGRRAARARTAVCILAAPALLRGLLVLDKKIAGGSVIGLSLCGIEFTE